MPLLRSKSGGNRTPAQRKKGLREFEDRAGIRFRNSDLLNQAFAHRSWANESSDGYENNERLEFLGDSVLGLVTAEYLYNELPDRPEGDLAKIKSFVVSEDSLTEIALSLSVDTWVLLGKGEENSGGRKKKAILADAMEAVIGAYFLDSGFKNARKFVRNIIAPQIQRVLENKHRKDYKTLLQEFVQKRYRSYPNYQLEKKTGPDHDRTYWMNVTINEKTFGPGKGKNKKSAEQNAAKIAYTALVTSAGHQ